MIKERVWPVRVMYMLIAAALAISLIITAAPALKVSAADTIPDAEWEMVSTPSNIDWVVANKTFIIDYAVGDDGEVAYAIMGTGYLVSNSTYLLKSTDYAATWDDNIHDALVDELEDDGYTSWNLTRVACDPEDADFVAVALDAGVGSVHVYTSTDGGATFRDTGEVEDGGVKFPGAWYVTDLAVSTEDDDERDIAIVGANGTANSTATVALIFRSTAVGEFNTGWRDARYGGWDNKWTGDPAGTANDLNSLVITDVQFAPSWDADRTILVTAINGSISLNMSGPYGIYLQYGTWGTTEGWNEQSTVSMESTLIIGGVNLPVCMGTRQDMQDFRYIAGLTMPLDFAGRHADKRVLWVWANYYTVGTNIPAGTIYRVKNGDVMGIGWQVEDEEVWLSNVSYLGYISEGKAIAGVLGTGWYAYDPTDPCANYYDLFTDCCEGVQVYRNGNIVNMDICCYDWDKSCKPPTGTKCMDAFYVSDDPASSKAYAVALWSYRPFFYSEGAWSVSWDDGYIWNQLSLINTDIDYLSDVAVSPDCNKMMLVSVNDCTEEAGYMCCCDSVWLKAENLPEAEEYSGKWLRTWCGKLSTTKEHPQGPEWGFLRLPPISEETTGDTVYLVDYYTDIVYWNEIETLGCWEDGTATVNHIVDLAVKDKETIYALDYSGTVAMSDDFALGWHEPVDSKVKYGNTIATWGDPEILVGGCDGDVSYSADDGETFELLDEEGISTDGYVTVAFDSYFDDNDTVYAALAMAPSNDNGIYRWVIGESEKWTDLLAEPLEWQICASDNDASEDYCESVEVNWTGLVLDNADGNPMTSADTGGVIYASYFGYRGSAWFTGVARYLSPAEELVCKECGDWDYLIEGLIENCDVSYHEAFKQIPDALKICGCLTPDTNSKLFAIDGYPEDGYDMLKAEDGTVWTFEDCYAKKAVDIVSPVDGATVASDPCYCESLPFSLCWDRLCDACSYDIQLALDEDFNELVFDTQDWCDYGYYGYDCGPCHYVPGSGENPCFLVDYYLICEFTYYWRVRASDAATDQIIHSWWSEPYSFTVAPGPEAGVELISPEAGATGVAINDIAFTWSPVSSADEYKWELSANSDLSDPIATSENLATTATTYSGTDLDYSTPHFWQVTAYKDGTPISTSTIGDFTTMAEPEEEPEPVTPPTPTWVWVVIAIGAVLVIVVIVLIFRTRRV